MSVRHSWQQFRTHVSFCRKCGWGKQYLPDHLRTLYERNGAVVYRAPSCDETWPEGWQPEWKRERGQQAA